MKENKTIELGLKDVYQLLISELRYGYSRNNHLMPSCAYYRVKDLIEKMYIVDSNYAIYTLKQICEECITDQLMRNFYNGYEDENGNRTQAIDFINWCMTWIHTHGDEHYLPYCWNNFEDNLAKDEELRYNVYELIDGEKKLVTERPVSAKDYLNYIFTKENLDQKNGVTYHHIVMRGDIGSPDYLPFEKASIKYEFIDPVKRVYIVEHI